jgi:hypothetical protein
MAVVIRGKARPMKVNMAKRYSSTCFGAGCLCCLAVQRFAYEWRKRFSIDFWVLVLIGCCVSVMVLDAHKKNSRGELRIRLWSAECFVPIHYCIRYFPFSSLAFPS